ASRPGQSSLLKYDAFLRRNHLKLNVSGPPQLIRLTGEEVTTRPQLRLQAVRQFEPAKQHCRLSHRVRTRQHALPYYRVTNMLPAKSSAIRHLSPASPP